MSGERACKNCVWWQNYNNRVWARISAARSSMNRNIIELRHCDFEPPPSVDIIRSSIYTDQDYVCGEWIKAV